MNTDGKYPLTIEEVKNSGMFKLPIHKNDWIYPFMIDRNNSGEVGEYDGQFEDAQPSEKQASKKPNAKIITIQEQANQNQSKQSQQVDPIQSQEKVVTESSTKTVDQQSLVQAKTSPTSYKTIANTNVKTGIKGMRPIVLVLIISTIGSLLLKRNKNLKIN